MNNISKLRVHIAPVGFEVDRIVLPAIEMRADKIWLLIHNSPMEDKAKGYVENIEKELKKAKIHFEIDRLDRLDLFMVLKSVKEIVEKEKDNDIYINVSSGSKIQAIACTMACMMFNTNKNITPYYAEPEHYPTPLKGAQQSTGLKRLVSLPSYEIHTPKLEHVKALKIIKEHNGKITKKEMAELAEKAEIITVGAKDENFEQARFASLDKNIIQPLAEQWHFVEIEKIGRNRWIKMTEDGKNAADFLI
ncbi:MAG TPA: DUF6293 family protein [Candidatus Nitrosotalea sp.]|nr:DUF6293 family protein [Candidatus Nitrosotalea sp.]